MILEYVFFKILKYIMFYKNQLFGMDIQIEVYPETNSNHQNERPFLRGY